MTPRPTRVDPETERTTFDGYVKSGHFRPLHRRTRPWLSDRVKVARGDVYVVMLLALGLLSPWGWMDFMVNLILSVLIVWWLAAALYRWHRRTYAKVSIQ